MDSLPVWNVEEDGEEGKEKCSYWGQGHKESFYNEQKEKKKWGLQKLKRLTDKKDKSEVKVQENCKYCGKPLLQKNYRDAVKDHCHVPGSYRGAVHSLCNKKLRINPKTDRKSVV